MFYIVNGFIYSNNRMRKFVVVFSRSKSTTGIAITAAITAAVTAAASPGARGR